MLITLSFGLYLFMLLAVERSRLIAKQADVIAAMSLEVLKGTTRAFDACKYKHHKRLSFERVTIEHVTD